MGKRKRVPGSVSHRYHHASFRLGASVPDKHRHGTHMDRILGELEAASRSAIVKRHRWPGMFDDVHQGCPAGWCLARLCFRDRPDTYIIDRLA